MNRTTLVSAALCGAMAMAGASFAQNVAISKDGRAENMSKVVPHKVGLNARDANFMKMAAQVHVAEIMLGKLAQKKAVSEWGFEYGKDMEREHSVALEDLKLLAEKKGVSLPDSTDAKHVAIYNRLSNMSGESFDRAYRQTMIAGHEMVAKKFAAQIKQGRDANVREYAVKVLPGVKHHREMAVEWTTMLNHTSMFMRRRG